MIWGKTNAQRRATAAAAIAKKKQSSRAWRKCFALIPVRLNDGRLLWLDWYERRIDYSWSNSGKEYTSITQRACL